MIKIFMRDETIFKGNGEKILTPSKCIVKEEDNGAYFASVECGLEYLDYIRQDDILVIPLQYNEQAFRVDNITKSGQRLKLKANHISYDTSRYLISDAYVVDKDANDALDHLNQACDDETPFRTVSNINRLNSYRCVRKSLSEALKTVVERWGGHIKRDNWKISLLEDIGEDKGVTVRYAKNLASITCTEDWSHVATKILPVGRDGITLEGTFVYSDIQYEIPYTKTVKFKQEIKKEDFESDEDYKNALRKDLEQQAREYVKESYIPRINYKLSANVDAEIGDTIEVIDERLGIDILTKVISTQYDAISRRIVKLEFGNFSKTLKGFANNVSETVDETIKEETERLENVVEVKLEESLEEANSKIWEAMGSSFVIYDLNRILIVDRLPKEEAKYCIQINNGGIGFSQNGIHGDFSSAWTIDGVLNMQEVNVINLTADLIKGGTLKLGSRLNQSGILEIYDSVNDLIGRIDKDGLRMNGKDGSYVILNSDVGFAGFDALDNKIYWVDRDEFHMKKAVVEEEITLCNKMRFIPIRVTDGRGNLINDGIGLVSTNL